MPLISPAGWAFENRIAAPACWAVFKQLEQPLKAKGRPHLIVPVTASWYEQLPECYARIGISRGPPRGQRGYRMYRPLAPGSWFRAVDAAVFSRLYLAQLAKLDPAKVLAELNEMAGGLIPALLCFEPPPPDPNWCHRASVSAWLGDALGIKVVEVGHETAGAGWQHPKQLRSTNPG